MNTDQEVDAIARPKRKIDIGHRRHEDVLALVTGTVLISLGINLFNQAGLLTGSTAGIAFLVHYVSGVSFGPIFFFINLPFYYFAFRRMGLRFTLMTFVAVGVVSILSVINPHFLGMAPLNPLYAAITGGLTMGTGFLVLFRHGASLGGVNVVALYVQDQYGIRAGILQLLIDLAIMVAAVLLIEPTKVFFSALGVLILNLIIAMNHRPGRYQHL